MTLPSLTPALRKRLCDELVYLHDTWTQLSSLFATSDEVITVLNATAASFFAGVRRVYMREVLLAISRLTDSAQVSGRDNLTIRALLEDPAVDSFPGLRSELTDAIDAAVTAAAPARAHRNKYIAHLDHATAIGAPPQPLPDLVRKDLSAAIAALEAAYNLHGRRVADSNMLFSLFSPGDAEDLVDVLRGSDHWRAWKELQAD